MTRRAAFYARVSTAHQEQDQTIDAQIAALEEAAAAAGMVVPPDRRFVDNGLSGSRLDRPALDALRDAAADGLIDLVLINSPDRLARNFVHQQVIVEELTKREVEVRFIERPIGERPEDRLLLQMQGVIAEYERAKIIERMRRGMRHKVRTGQTLPFSKPPYGYAIVRSLENPRGVLVVDEVEAEHVRSMFRWVREENLSVRRIAQRLNQLGVRPRQRSFWVLASVYRILTNSVYTGTAVYGKREAVEPKRPRKIGAYRHTQRSSFRMRSPAHWIEVPVPAIIDTETRDAALAQLAKNKFTAKRNTQREYLLRTLVVCGECGWRMSARYQISQGKSRGYLVYVCDHRDALVTGRLKRCTSRRVHADELDKVVWDALTSWIQSPEMLLREVDAWRASRAGAQQLGRNCARIETTLQRLDLQLDRLIDAYQRGAITVEELRGRRERVEADRDAARLRHEQLSTEAMDSARMDRLGDDLAAFAATLRVGIKQLDFEGRLRLVRLLIERVVVTGDNIAIEHAIPLSGRFSQLRSAH